MIHYPIKSIPQTCLTFSYIDENGITHFKNKKRYKEVKEAKKQADYLNKKSNQIHKVSHYFCKTCGYWHIGRTNILL